MKKAYRMVVEGRVQGVGYRSYIFTHARMLGLKGYVKNLIDGKVEIIIIGDADAIHQFRKLSNKGPSFAWVYNIQYTEIELKEEYEDFKIYY